MDQISPTFEECIEDIRLLAERSKFLCEVSLNVKMTTMIHYDLPWMKDAPITDLVDITSKYRAAGVIQ